ncbi:hypothetical protein [Tissierella sp.]|uniref:hypothetical protein n=1 Tax=Tissierella sp. TaxID=41274 RepID=UPI00303C1604
MTNEYRQAVQNLKHKQLMYELASQDFEEVAYHEMKAAEARVEALVREAKEAM